MRFDQVANVIVNADHSILRTAAVHRVADCITRRVIPQPTEREKIGNEFHAAMIPAWADFVNVDDLNSFDIPLIESFE